MLRLVSNLKLSSYPAHISTQKYPFTFSEFKLGINHQGIHIGDPLIFANPMEIYVMHAILVPVMFSGLQGCFRFNFFSAYSSADNFNISSILN